MGGLPQKPKVQGYIQQEAFDKFQDYCKLHKLSQSAGLDVVIAGFFGIKREVTEREQHEQTTTSIETSNILVAEISKLNERVGILERWKLDIESLSDISEDISTANLTCPIAEPAANLGEPVANTLANLNREAADILVNPIQSGADTSMGIADTIANPDVNPGTGISC